MSDYVENQEQALRIEALKVIAEMYRGAGYTNSHLLMTQANDVYKYILDGEVPR